MTEHERAAASLKAAEVELQAAQRDFDGSEESRQRYRSAVWNWRVAEAVALLLRSREFFIDLTG